MIKENCEYMNKKVYSNLEYNDSKNMRKLSYDICYCVFL